MVATCCPRRKQNSATATRFHTCFALCFKLEGISRCNTPKVKMKRKNFRKHVVIYRIYLHIYSYLQTFENALLCTQFIKNIPEAFKPPSHETCPEWGSLCHMMATTKKKGKKKSQNSLQQQKSRLKSQHLLSQKSLGKRAQGSVTTVWLGRS